MEKKGNKFINNFGKSYKDFTFSIDPSLTNLDINEVIQTNKKQNSFNIFHKVVLKEFLFDYKLLILSN